MRPTTTPAMAETLQTLREVATATLSVALRKRGLHRVVIEGVAPLNPTHRMAGVARTLRYLPSREDVEAARRDLPNIQKSTIDDLGQDEVLVIGARGVPNAGTIGDLLALRAMTNGAAGVVTDGAVRDRGILAGMDLPVFANGHDPRVLRERHVVWEADVAIGCGEALVLPGDVIVGDADGAMVIPAGLAAEVAGEARQAEHEEAYIGTQIEQGVPVVGLYPLTGEHREGYERWDGPR